MATDQDRATTLPEQRDPADQPSPGETGPYGPDELRAHIADGHGHVFAAAPSWGFLDELHYLLHVPACGHAHTADAGPHGKDRRFDRRPHLT
jgi:hypothetical protein